MVFLLVGASLVAQPQPAPQQGEYLTLPAGTLLTVRLIDPLSTDHNQAGDGFTATLTQPLVADGMVVARRGQMVVGRVNLIEKAGRIKGTSKLGVELGEMILVNGHQTPIQTELLEYRGGTSHGRDAGAIATTTGFGAAIGSGVNGGVGAGIGAGIGLAAGVAGVLLTRGRPTELYPETMLTFRLTAPVAISTDRGGVAFHPVVPEDYGDTRPVRTRAGGPPPPPGYYAPYPYYAYAYPYYGPIVGWYWAGPRFGYRRYRW